MKDPFLWIVDNELVIPGVQREHVFLHVSDTHICASDELSSAQEVADVAAWDAKWMRGKESFAHSFGEPFGEAQRISTVAAFAHIMEYASEEKPDGLLLSGDLLECMHPAGERLLSKSLERYGRSYLCVPGNHESENCPGAWKAGVQVLEYEGFRVVGVDDRLKTVTDADMDRLEALSSEGIPMIILYHIPIAASGNQKEMKKFSEYFVIDRETGDANAKRFIRFLEESEVVKMALCGHVHGYSDTQIIPGKRQITASQGMIGFVNRLVVHG